MHFDCAEYYMKLAHARTILLWVGLVETTMCACAVNKLSDVTLCVGFLPVSAILRDEMAKDS